MTRTRVSNGPIREGVVPLVKLNDQDCGPNGSSGKGVVPLVKLNDQDCGPNGSSGEGVVPLVKLNDQDCGPNGSSGEGVVPLVKLNDQDWGPNGSSGEGVVPLVKLNDQDCGPNRSSGEGVVPLVKLNDQDCGPNGSSGEGVVPLVKLNDQDWGPNGSSREGVVPLVKLNDQDWGPNRSSGEGVVPLVKLNYQDCGPNGSFGGGVVPSVKLNDQDFGPKRSSRENVVPLVNLEYQRIGLNGSSGNSSGQWATSDDQEDDSPIRRLAKVHMITLSGSGSDTDTNRNVVRQQNEPRLDNNRVAPTEKGACFGRPSRSGASEDDDVCFRESKCNERSNKKGQILAGDKISKSSSLYHPSDFLCAWASAQQVVPEVGYQTRKDCLSDLSLRSKPRMLTGRAFINDVGETRRFNRNESSRSPSPTVSLKNRDKERRESYLTQRLKYDYEKDDMRGYQQASRFQDSIREEGDCRSHDGEKLQRRQVFTTMYRSPEHNIPAHLPQRHMDREKYFPDPRTEIATVDHNPAFTGERRIREGIRKGWIEERNFVKENRETKPMTDWRFKGILGHATVQQRVEKPKDVVYLTRLHFNDHSDTEFSQSDDKQSRREQRIHQKGKNVLRYDRNGPSNRISKGKTNSYIHRGDDDGSDWCNGGNRRYFPLPNSHIQDDNQSDQNVTSLPRPYQLHRNERSAEGYRDIGYNTSRTPQHHRYYDQQFASSRTNRKYFSSAGLEEDQKRINKPSHQMKLEHFDGSAQVESFVTKFEICASHNNWSESEKMANLQCTLTGNAAQILWDMGAEGVTSAELVNQLRTRFGSANQTALYRTQLKCRRRQRGESLSELINDVHRLVVMAYPGPSSSMKESFACEAFLESLRWRSYSLTR